MEGQQQQQQASGSSSSNKMAINKLEPNMRGLNLVFIVLDIGQPQSTAEGNVLATIKVADHSGCVNLKVWNDYVDAMQPGDIIRLKNGNTSIHKGSLQVQVNKQAELIKVSEFFMQYSEVPNMSEVKREYVELARQQAQMHAERIKLKQQNATSSPAAAAT